MTSNPTNSRIAIIGGGPGGLMLARLLQVRGVATTVFERDRYAGERPQGGSLDIHSDTGQEAIRRAGLAEAFAAAARPEDQGDRLYDEHGTLLFDRDGSGDDRPEIDRTALRQILLDSLDVGTVRWDSHVDAVAPQSDVRWTATVDGMPQDFDIVIGADGAWSRVRPLLTDAQPLYEGVTLIEFGFDVARHPEIDALVGNGKMFAAGNNRLLIGQRNGHGHIRGGAGLRVAEETARAWTDMPPERVRGLLLDAFAGWAPSLRHLIESGDFIAVRPLYGLPIGQRWASRAGITLLGDAAHLMSPFSGEGVNLALADAVDLADAILSGEGWGAIAAYEKGIIARAIPAAEGAQVGLNSAVSPHGVGPIFAHYEERVRGVSDAR